MMMKGLLPTMECSVCRSLCSPSPLAAPLHRPGVAQMPGGVGASARFAQQLFPLFARQAARVPVGAGVLAPAVEETDVVVLLLQRPDLGLDEPVELVEVLLNVLGNVEIHGGSLGSK